MQYLKNLKITVPTSTLALSRADAKLHLNILDTSFDDLIDDYLASAHLQLAKEASILVDGTAVGYLPSADDFYIDLHEVSTVVIKYYDAANSLQVWDAANYVITDNRVEIIGSAPSTYDRVYPWQITITTATNTDPGVIQALRMLVGDLFEQRQGEAVGGFYNYSRGTQWQLNLISKRIEI